MSDLIERNDAIKAYCEHECGKGMTREKCGAVDCGTIFDDIPPAQQWIPVSEMLPETTDEVLTTYIVNGNRKKRFVETATYYDDDEGYWSSPWDEYRISGTKVEVIAWMPLPEPYKESEDEMRCTCTDEEIAKSFIEDVEAVKDLLPRAERED